MSIAKLHTLFKERSGVLGNYRDLTPYEIDLKLNEAQRWVLEQSYSDQNTQIKKDTLGPFIERETVSFQENVKGKLYTFDLDNLNKEYVHLMRVTYKCDDEDAVVPILDFDEITRKLRDAHQKPSKKWNRSLAVIIDNELHVYTEQNLSEGTIEYIRKPKEVYFGGYDTNEYIFCNQNSGNNCDDFYHIGDDPQTSEFSNHYQDLIVDVAVWLATGKTANSLITQLINQKIILSNQ